MAGLFKRLTKMFKPNIKEGCQNSKVSPEVSRAIQRNERAGHAVQDALEEMLSRNDGLHGEKK